MHRQTVYMLTTEWDDGEREVTLHADAGYAREELEARLGYPNDEVSEEHKAVIKSWNSEGNAPLEIELDGVKFTVEKRYVYGC